MNTDAVGHLNSLALVVGHNAGKVLDGAKAVTSQLQVISHDTGTNITKIECSLLVEGVTRVTVGDRHVGQGETVEDVATIVTDIVKNHALSLIEADAERPLLPLHSV